MAEKGAQDKTEKPTPRRRGKAREQGQVAKSQEAGSVAVLLAGMAALTMFIGFMYGTIHSFATHVFVNLQTFQISIPFVHGLSMELIDLFLRLLFPLMMAVVVAAVVINLAQVGMMIAPKKIKPDLKKINPITGAKRFFSLRLLVDLAKNLGKLLVVGGVGWYTLAEEWENLQSLADMSGYQMIH